MDQEVVYEPLVDNTHLNSSQSYVKDITPLVTSLVEVPIGSSPKIDPVEIIPPNLRDTSLYLAVEGTKQIPTELEIKIELLDRLHTRDSSRPFATELKMFIDLSTSTITGFARNDLAHKTFSDKIKEKTVLHNFSGTVAPVEDAISQSVANILNRPFTRSVNIPADRMGKRYVQNYLERGYREATKDHQTITLQKRFDPSPTM